MDQSRVQCPVCTLYLHSGMSLESHLDTHPKDQVIKALCSLSAKTGSYSSRTSTPSQSERSYRSRSRTPATDDGIRWMGSQRSESERYWHRTPSRNKSTPLSNASRNVTPEITVADFDSNPASNSHYSELSYPPMRSDKTQQTYAQTPMRSDFDSQPYSYYSETQDDKEVKYSRTSEYTTMDNATNTVTFNSIQATQAAQCNRSQTTVPPTVPKKGNNLVKILPKPNLLLNTNLSGVQYMTPGVKPVHVMVPAAPTFLQKNVQSNMILTGGTIPCTTIFDPKAVPTQVGTNPLSSNALTPGTTVVTQNSQIIYREMVHSIDGKPFVSNMPTVLSGHNTVTNVAQTSSLYQNVMLVDQFGNASCLYPPPQIIPKPCNATVYNETTFKNIPTTPTNNVTMNTNNDGKKSLTIEVGPIAPTVSNLRSLPAPAASASPHLEIKNQTETIKHKYDTPCTSKGLKILSNIKVEVPVQHHKNMLNTIMDLTGSQDNDYPECADTHERKLSDLEDTKQKTTQNSTVINNDCIANSFSVIKNLSSSKLAVADSKMETEFSDSSPVPDLICNEKPSISPCSELSELGENSTDQPSVSPKHKNFHKKIDHQIDKSIENEPCKRQENEVRMPYKSNALRLNNIYVKKNKKILQIKNAKPFSEASASNNITNISEPKPSSSSCKLPENFSINRISLKERTDTKELGTSCIDIKEDKNDDHHEFDADTEEQSMDIEPIVPSSLDHTDEYHGVSVNIQVKEEVNTSNEGAFSNEADTYKGEEGMETLKAIAVTSYGNIVASELDDDSNHKELLDLEAVSKNKQFVSMMNENYFGDNIYADYFTPDRGEAFDAAKETNFGKNSIKEGIYIWGEPSQKEGEGEFILPNFIHESYKLAEGMGYSGMSGEEQVDGEKCEPDTKADVLSESRSDGEVSLNICADERMPPRGELSGQESNGEMESPWTGMYTEMASTEPYDLIARESWVSDGSETDTNEKRENLEEELPYPKGRQYTCGQCCSRFPSVKELRAHRSLAHGPPACSSGKTTYSRMVTARTIKKEERADDSVIIDGALASNLLAISDAEMRKPDIASTMLQVYDAMADTKPAIEGLIKQETKRRRKDFVCPTCKVDQLNDVAFHAHLKLHPLECLTCGKCFFKRANLALHMKTHLGIRNYKCDICEKRFITRQKLAEHYNVHTGRAPYKCTHCDDTFRRHSNMVQHRDRHHFQKKAKVRDYVCHCGQVFHSRAKLLWHKETHSARPKACLYCSDKFVHAASLTRHVRRSHNEYYLSERAKGREENVPCPVCKQIYLRTNLRAHLQTHSGKRPHLCVICNKGFTTKWNLKLHRWTHASRSSKPFKCNLCKGAFIRQTDYVSHMNAHKSVRPYTCNYCGCQFIRKYNCQRHVREHEMAKKYVCKVPECGKSFHRSYYLSEHMKVHSGARPFSCNICGKTSSNKSNHNKHVKIHHAREPVATEA